MKPLVIEKQTFTYKTVDGCQLQADVYISQPLAPRPVLLWIHGGALISGSRSQLPAYQLEIYLRAGFTVVSIDYRLAPETQLEQIIEDLRDAYTWIITHGPHLFELDGERVAVVGHSAGGYLTLMAGHCVQPRPKAVVAFYGYGDIIGEWYSRPDPFYCNQATVSVEDARRAVGHGVVTEARGGERGFFYLYCRQTGRWPIEVAGHDPDLEPEWFRGFCPLHNVTSNYPPTLLIHGVPDTDVPYEQSPLMAQQLAVHKVEHELITLPVLGHAFDMRAGAEHSTEVLTIFGQVVEFLGTHG
jgi:acetyl esterase/lipase